MYRLTVVAGPTRGNSYPLHEGETSVGRLSTNGLVLNSGKVSKTHCVLVVSNGTVVVKDQGSSNGTFVNGVLARTPRQIASGDRVSVGEFVLELSELSSEQARRPVALSAKVGAHTFKPGLPGAPVGAAAPLPELQMVKTVPSDLRGRMLWFFEYKLMPSVYQLLLKHEWSTLLFWGFGLFAVLSVAFVLLPQVQLGDQLVIREMERRAAGMARVIVETNTSFIQQQQEGKTAILQSIANGRGVRQALLVDLDSRIIAPADRHNSYLSQGVAAVEATRARKRFLEGRTGIYTAVSGADTVVAVEPMILYSPKEGKNIPVAMGIVTLDGSISLSGIFDQAISYLQALIILGVFGVVIALVLYRLTLKPLQVLHDEVDRSLKGERLSLTRELKFSELGQLLDVVETALQRSASASASGPGGGMESSVDQGLRDDAVASYRMLADSLPSPVAVCDSERRPLYVNQAFEDVTGIRMDIGESRQLSALARDQAFGVLLSDLFDRSPGSMDGVSEDFEFSGVAFRVRMAALMSSGGQARAYVFLAQKSEAG
jgi:pSer/pThr/pTyr-binding forkhead associated (FHA) protein